MKKTGLVKSFVSFLLSGVLMFTVFSSYNYEQPTAADVKINGVKGKIYDFRDIIIDKFNTDNYHQSNKTQVGEKVHLGGFTVGLKLYADGVVVVDTESVDTPNGLVNTAKNAGIEVGDVIKYINNKKVTSNKQVSQIIEKSNGEIITLKVARKDEILTLNFRSAYSQSEQKYKAGIWIRDSSAGIGTVTFVTEDGYFSSLGHAVCDIDTNEVIPICQGDTTDVKIIDIKKGTNGCAGELCGYLESRITGKVFYNGDLGVYGKFQQKPETKLFEVASKYEIQKGSAYVFTTLENGETERFSIEITDVIKSSNDNKNLVIKVTDQSLLEKTGGIVQGMSGSPIIQNGKLIGAVTHVFLNDPTGGYGIFAETMLDNVKTMQQSQNLKDAG